MAETYSMDEKKRKEDEGELVLGQRGFDAPRNEVTMKDFESKSPKPKRQTFNERFIKTEKGSFARRGTAPAQRAENRERNRNRAKAAAKARMEKKNK